MSLQQIRNAERSGVSNIFLTDLNKIFELGGLGLEMADYQDTVE